jgi:predicted  nucleic acid-binding Zn-ribbon protein
MARLSDLNKEERKVQAEIDKLRKQYRKKDISKRDFNKALLDQNKELEKIHNEKSKLIGEDLGPLPPPPKPPKRPSGESGLDSIKKSILGEKEDIEPPGPPVVLKEIPKLPEIKKTIIKEKIKEVPIIKERIKKVEVPVIKEKIKEVPVIKEKIKEVKVPVIKTVKVPTGDPELGKKITDNFKEINDIKIDVTRHEQELSQLMKDINDVKKKFDNFDDMKAEVKAMKMRMDKIDFPGLTQEIYNQFENMNSNIKEFEKRTDDLAEKTNVELKTLKEKLDEAKQAKEHVDNLDISNIRRDMESLKQKSQYIEQHIEKVDIRPIVEMIKDVENKVSTLRASSALIIE